MAVAVNTKTDPVPPIKPIKSTSLQVLGPRCLIDGEGSGPKC